MWGYYFIMMGTINIFVAYHYSTNVWVNFKVFGMFGLTVIFVIIQTVYLYKHIQPETNFKE